MSKTKVCKGVCGKRRALKHFSKHPNSSDGLRYMCRDCAAVEWSSWYAINSEKVREHGRKRRKGTIDGYLKTTYDNMKKRVEGRSSKDAHLWAGLPIVSKEKFIAWSKNNHDFLRLFKLWTLSEYDKNLSPSVNRDNPKKGYIMGNMTWMTTSRNRSLAGTTRSFNKRKAVYELLGEKRG